MVGSHLWMGGSSGAVGKQVGVVANCYNEGRSAGKGWEGSTASIDA